VRLAAVAALALAGALAAALLMPQAGTGTQRLRCGPMGDYAFPGETLTEWVSYYDQLSLIRVVKDRHAAP
jgi:hypothetical protein